MIKKDDLKCKCCGKYDIDDRLLKILKMIDKNMVNITKINSGYRCVNHNAKVKGKPNSNHMKGEAADIIVKDRSIIYDLWDKKIIGGLGIYDNFIHVDCGIHRKWNG